MDNSYGLQELQEQLLIILDDIDRVCRAHGIEYTLAGGTLLGAVRHKGFIPWDDDADVCMMREEFNKFKKIYPKEMRRDFKISAVCNLATYCVVNPGYVISGITKQEGTVVNPWVSIFPFDYAPENVFMAKIKANILRMLSGMMGKPPQYANFPPKSRRMWDITSCLGKIVGKKCVDKWFDRLCQGTGKRESGSKFISSYTENTSNIYKRFSADLLKRYKDMPFEDRTYRTVYETDKYLTFVYGDYMTPLPPENRKPGHLIGKS